MSDSASGSVTGPALVGLGSVEVAARLRQFGPNAVDDAAPALWRALLGKFLAPVPCLLEAAIVLQLILGEYLEAGIIAVLLVFNAVLGLVQEGRAQATVAALKSRLALNAAVLRDRRWQVIAASRLVPGDIVKLSLGAIVPADVQLISGSILVDLSMLTGESVPVEAASGFEAPAGALIRRGEAVAQVTATGARTKFGRTAELVRAAKVASSQQKAVLRVVVYLAAINGALAAALIGYAIVRRLPAAEVIPLGLIAVLASVPVALPATFTLAGAVGALALGQKGVLPTRLSAVDEAAAMNLLCVDKTGTLTSNELVVTRTLAMAGHDEGEVLVLARLASSDGGLDTVDAAVRTAAARQISPTATALLSFTPFDPGLKMAEAEVLADGEHRRIVKGAFAHVMAICRPRPAATAAAAALEDDGLRVLGVAVGVGDDMQLVGLLALSDPPRPEAAGCIAALKEMGIQVVMVTGDAPKTAAAVARAVGIDGPIHSSRSLPPRVSPEDVAVFAAVLPEDKFHIVQAFQRAGFIVGMCGDGANDAPALRQAQLGIAVSTATDVAKSAAGLVLTEPGLFGVLSAVTEGRIAFQRILTYTLRSIIHKVRQVSYLGVGLVLTGHAILTPMLVVIVMITGDFFAMSATTDNVRPSKKPNAWRIGNLVIAGALLGLVDLAFCVVVLVAGQQRLHLDLDTLRTLTMVNLVFNGQAVFYSVRERRHLWSSRPSNIVLVCSAADLFIIPVMALGGFLMAPLPSAVVAAVLAGAVVFALVLDLAKSMLFKLLRMT